MQQSIVLGVLFAMLCGGYQPTVEELAERAISPDPRVAAAAVEALREAGPDGLAAFVKAHEAALADPTERIANAIDAIGMQKDNFASRLFWFTDMEAAKTLAAREQKPILSLRLLGNLNEDLSCANSRFFRTALYADPAISRVLREQFVLHWQSVRPVPKITVDMGDGRKIARTITGNSIHYVLAPDGKLVDGIPGLYAPKTFFAQIVAAGRAAVGTREQDTFHSNALADIERAWNRDLAQAAAGGERGAIAPSNEAATAPDRAQFGAKTAVEAEMLDTFTEEAQARLARSTRDGAWSRIAALHAVETKLSPGSIALLRRKSLDTAPPKAFAIAKERMEDPLRGVITNFERSIAEDTVRNEYLFHTQIHRWLLEDPNAALAEFNERVYAELFLAPSSDPWMGLVPKDTYAALDGCGVVE